MGLDVYLSGRSFFIRGNGQEIDGMPVEEIRVKLGYWRKDWVLHNFMCETFGPACDDGGFDISANELRHVLGAIQAQELKNKDGTTYTGENCAEYGTQNTLDVLKQAIEWIERASDGEWRDAVYRGSW